MAIFKGSGVAIVTPFQADNEVNYQQLEQLINFQIENGTDSIIIAGTTGESATLTTQEHKNCIQAAVACVKGRVPVIAGTGSNNTEHAVELTKTAEKCGADAVLAVTPYYNKATQKGLIQYYTRIAGASSLPVIMYNVPSRTGCNILPNTAAVLAKEVENITAVKDATGNISQTMEMMELAEGNLDLYSGNDDQVIPLLSAGGIGVISVLANIAPRQTHDMVMEYLNGNREQALQLQLKALPLIRALFSQVNPIPVKAALGLMGRLTGGIREPLTPMEEEYAERLKQEMKAYGIL
ncbi:MAG: 4-hydroxy-tetrahydrodipicolinate synthase [Lachnospiraceae bacterium]